MQFVSPTPRTNPTKVFWQLPDNSTLVTRISDIQQLLTLLQYVDTVSLNAVTYSVRNTELVVDSESVSVAISLI